MNVTFSYLNGRFVETTDLCFPVSTDMLGTLRGARVFSSCRTVNQKVFHLEDHMNRLRRNATELGFNITLSDSEITRAIFETLLRNRHLNKELLLIIMLSGGMPDATGMVPIGPALLYIYVSPLTAPQEEEYKKGVALALFAHERPFASIKILNYIGAMIAHQTVVKEHQAIAPLFITEEENPYLLEGSTFNVFIVKNGLIYTPPLNGKILDGVTRKVLIKLAKEKGFEVEECPILASEIADADECFISSTTRGALPVTRIDQTQIGKGNPGPVTLVLVQAYTQYIAEY